MTTSPAPTFQSDDVVRYDTGTTYLVGGQSSEGVTDGRDLGVVGWKNGNRFGAWRRIDSTRCTLIGHATDNGDGTWEFIPA